MPYGSALIDTITSSGNLAITGNVSTSGNVTVANVSTSGTISATGNITGGNLTATGRIIAATFSTPLLMTSASLGTATAGNFEYDGKVPYFTPLGTQRGIIPGMQYYALSSGYTGTNSSGSQSVFGVGVTLSDSTQYMFEAVYAISRATGTTSHNWGLAFGGTATLNTIAYIVNGEYNGTSFTTTTTVMGNIKPGWFIQTAAQTQLVGSITTSGVYFAFMVKGYVSVSSGGTFIPQYYCSAAPGGAHVTAAGSYFAIYPIGATGSNISVGTWA